MKYIYGKNDLKTLSRAQENCYLLTNGLGGFSSCTMAGSVSRNDHAFLMACVQAPNCRVNMVHRLEETLITDGKSMPLSSQQFADGSEENGLKALTSFSFEDYPQWFYQTGGVEIVKSIGMKQGENTAAVVYEITNRSRKRCTLKVRPFLQFTPKGTDLEKDQEFALMDGFVRSADYELYFKGNGTFENFRSLIRNITMPMTTATAGAQQGARRRITAGRWKRRRERASGWNSSIQPRR